MWMSSAYLVGTCERTSDDERIVAVAVCLERQLYGEHVYTSAKIISIITISHQSTLISLPITPSDSEHFDIE